MELKDERFCQDQSHRLGKAVHLRLGFVGFHIKTPKGQLQK